MRATEFVGPLNYKTVSHDCVLLFQSSEIVTWFRGYEEGKDAGGVLSPADGRGELPWTLSILPQVIEMTRQ